jgi:hypothetical protein
VILGLVVVAFGFALRASSLPGRLVAGIAALCLSPLAGLVYAGFILIGINGVPHARKLEATVRVSLTRLSTDCWEECQCLSLLAAGGQARESAAA